MIKALLIFFVLELIYRPMIVHGRQKYPELSSQNCDIAEPYSSLYTCNGEAKSCKAFLIFKAQPPNRNTVRTISNLFSSIPRELSRVNKATNNFETNQEVIIPVNCSCSGQHYYHSDASVTVGRPDSDTFFRVATVMFQGLSTCESLKRANRPLGDFDLTDGMELKVPLRCACPTRNQTRNGTNFLLTYPVNVRDNIQNIAKRFNVTSDSIHYANELSLSGQIFSDVPILIPLPTEPSSSQTVTHSDETRPISHPRFHDLEPKQPRSNNNRNLFVVFAIIAACSVLVLLVVLVFFAVHKKRKSSINSNLPRRQRSRKSLSPKELRREIASFERAGPRAFGIEEIRRATESFGPENRIKGSVYRGVFADQNTAKANLFAVKKTKKDPTREVNMLKKLNHFNLTKLEGVCTHRNRYYMVFEYMENGSLREWLASNNNNNNNNNGNINKSWVKRIEIALDIAHGLNYLHSFTKPGYVHKNIKTSNILLDKDTRAKISNFALAGPATDLTTSRSMSDLETTIVAASHVVGTRGYVAPEYLANGISTTKIDVFAFGVVVLELLSGKKALTVEDDGKHVLLYARIAEIMGLSGDDVARELETFVDRGLIREDDHDHDRRFVREFGLRLAKLSIACLNRDPESRPRMSEVVSSLSKILADLQRFDYSA